MSKQNTFGIYTSSFLSTAVISAQSQQEMIDKIVKEAEDNSQLENLAHELLDVVGPRLVGTPQMKNAHDWAVKKYNSWDIICQK